MFLEPIKSQEEGGRSEEDTLSYLEYDLPPNQSDKETSEEDQKKLFLEDNPTNHAWLG